MCSILRRIQAIEQRIFKNNQNIVTQKYRPKLDYKHQLGLSLLTRSNGVCQISCRILYKNFITSFPTCH